MKVVYIGHGSSGWTSATTLRAWDRTAEITIIDKKNYDAYHPCAMPYAIGGLWEDESPLIESLNYDMMKINFLRRHEALNIDRQNKKVNVKNLENDEVFEVEYDYLVICIGSKAKFPPIPGADGKNVHALKWIEDSAKIREAAAKASKAVVLGASAIGLEVATELAHRGIETAVLARSRLMRLLIDPDYANETVKLLEEKLPKLKFVIGVGINEIVLDENGMATKVTTDQGDFDCDFVVAATGIRPEVTLAQEAGLKIGESGAIVTDEELKTSDPNILAVGDCAETIHLVSKQPINSAIATCCVRMARVAAMTIAKPGTLKFPGTMNNFIVPFIDLRVGSVGLIKKAAEDAGFEVVIAKIKTHNKPPYMPDAEELYFKILADKNTGKILGAQAIGPDSITDNLNVISLGMQNEMTFLELLQSDLCYAPAVNETIYPVTQALEMISRKMLRRKK